MSAPAPHTVISHAVVVSLKVGGAGTVGDGDVGVAVEGGDELGSVDSLCVAVFVPLSDAEAVVPPPGVPATDASPDEGLLN